MVISREPEVKILEVAEPAVRLDKYLANACPELSRSRLQKLIKQGYVLINGCVVAKASQRLNVGDRIHVMLPPPEQLTLVAESISLTVVYEDDELLIIDKPAGLVVHPSPGYTTHTLVNALLARCFDLASFADSMRPGIVHRLDKDTSGLIIIAKNISAQQYLIRQFKAREVYKGYLVLVKGRLTPSQGIIDAPLGRDPSNRKRMAIVAGGKMARTKYKVREYLGDYTFLEVTTETGRTHQIRVHLAAIGYPVVGDLTYGVKSVYVRRQFVHAYRLGFRLPSTGEYREFTCELPADLTQALQLIRLIRA